MKSYDTHARETFIPRNETKKAWFVGGGIAALSGAVFLIRDGGLRGQNITIFEELAEVGGSMDGAGNPEDGYILRGGRMLNAPAYECTWDLFKSIPSLTAPDLSVFEETMAFNRRVKTHAHARLVDRDGARIDVETMGFSMRDRTDLLRLLVTKEEGLNRLRIRDWFEPEFFRTNFWFMWSTTFAFQPWHSLAELRRYLKRFMHEFPRIQTLAGVTRTTYNQYDSMIVPLKAWLQARGVNFTMRRSVVDLPMSHENGRWTVRGMRCECVESGMEEELLVDEGDLVFVTNGSMTDASSLGSMTSAPKRLTRGKGSSWLLWEKLAEGRLDFGNPRAFDSNVAESAWESFTITLRDPEFFDAMSTFTDNEAGTGALVTFKDSSWLLSVVLAHQPHFVDQPAGVQVLWGYGLNIDRVGDFVPKPMSGCTGREILDELRGHLRFEPEVFRSATCIPCMLPFITAEFMPRLKTDRPLPVPASSRNLAFISQFVEIESDVVFTVEYSIRAAQMAVYQLLGIDRTIPAVSRHDKTLKVQVEALASAFR